MLLRFKMMTFINLSAFSILVFTVCCVTAESVIVPEPDTEIAEAMYTESSCKKVLKANPKAPSGVYNLRAVYSENVIQVYCEMGLNGGGYTFINPQYLDQLTSRDIQAWFTDKQSFLMRIRKTGGSQPYMVLKQLPEYVSIPLKLGLNENNLYSGPVNAPILGSPYLFFGFLSVADIRKHNQQGLQANGQRLAYEKCDSSPSRQITLFPNFSELPPTQVFFREKFPFCDKLFGAVVDNPSSRAMPVEYFMFTETHWGCVCYTQTDARLKPSGILGTTIGFR